MNIEQASDSTSNSASKRPTKVSATMLHFLLVFTIAFATLFLGMSRHPNFFDEGIVLTAAMRTASGQLPHRDFYTLYGPAQFYLLAGMFRVFGESMLVERLFDLVTKALVVTAVYASASLYCRKSTATWVSLAALLWLFGLNNWSGSAVIAVSLLNIAGAVLILPVLSGSASGKRLFAAGAIAGMAALFRYDTGVALLAVQLAVLVTAAGIRPAGLSAKLLFFLSNLGPHLLGFALLTIPAAIYYLSVAPRSALLHDMILYPARYYHRGRNLPFPGIGLHSIENVEVYVPVAVAALALFIAVNRYIQAWRTDQSPRLNADRVFCGQACNGFLLVFGLLTLAMYAKALVRVSLFQTYLAIIPSLLLLAVLLDYKLSFQRALRVGILCLATLSLMAVTSLDWHIAKELYLTHWSVPQYVGSLVRGTMPPREARWCEESNPLTVGLCFVTEEPRMQTIAFLRSHTTPEQTLYSGLARHDMIFGNDNLVYFGAQRLPATKWSELDPDLESHLDTQLEMINELTSKRPPFVVLDSEFAGMNEPNDSSKSSGVTLLDDYIRNNYQLAKTFGYMAIWRRSSP